MPSERPGSGDPRSLLNMSGHYPEFTEGRLRSGLHLLVVAVLALSFGILAVPYGGAASSTLPTSASALLGFNNTLSYALYIPLLAAVAWILSTFIRWPEGGVFAVPEVLLPFPTKRAWGVFAGHAALFGMLYSFKGQFVFSEALYFQHTAYRVFSGETPYVGFNYLYGPATIYPPALLAQIISLPAAYALYYVGVYLLGLYALYVALKWFGFDGNRADTLFLLLAVGFFNPLAGLNYTPLRHLLPLLAVIATWSYVVRGTRQWLLASALIVWLAIMYSPDMGAVALGGVLLAGGASFAATRFFRRRPTNSGPGAVGVLAVLAVTAVLTVAVFATMPDPVSSLMEYVAIVTRLAGGGSNTPVQPSLPLASLIALTAVTGGAAIAAFRARGVVQDIVLLTVLVATLGALQRAAFAKPDILHLAFVGLPMFVVGLKLFGCDRRRTVPVPLVLGLASLVLPLHYFNVVATWPAVAPRLFTRTVTQSAKPSTPVPNEIVSQTPIPDQLQFLVSRMGDETSYYMHNLTYYSLPVYINNGLRHALYFTTPEEAFTDEDVQGVVQTLAAQDTAILVLRTDVEGPAQATQTGSGFQRAVNMFAASALPGSITYDATVLAVRTLWNPFLSYLRRCYEVREETADLVGLSRSNNRVSCGPDDF